MLTTGLAVLAVTQRNQARDERTTAQSRELSAASLLNLGDDPELSVLLAQRAAGVRGTDQARDALRQSLLASRVRASFNGHTGGIEDLDLSPDGALAATTSVDGTLRTWEVPSGKPVATMREPKGFALVQAHFSPDGTMVGAATDSATIHIWNPRTGEPVATIVDPRDYRPQERGSGVPTRPGWSRARSSRTPASGTCGPSSRWSTCRRPSSRTGSRGARTAR